MIVECETLSEIELAAMYSQLLLNSKILSLVKNRSASEPIRVLKSSDGKIAVYNINKHNLFFSAATEPDSALEIFIYLNADYAISVIEGSIEIINKIGSHLKEIDRAHDIANMLLMSKEIDANTVSIPSDFEFLSGNDLIDFGAEVLVCKFSAEKLNTSLTEGAAKELILSTSREFMGLKVEDNIVSIAAWIREIEGFRCISYVYTDEEFRGNGFGGLLLAKFLSDACDKYKGVFLFVEESNFAAIRLYSKLGFNETGHLSQLKLS